MTWDFPDVWCGKHRAGYRSYCHPDIFPQATPPLAERHLPDAARREGRPRSMRRETSVTVW
uniref:Ovocleidin-17 (OC-17) n=1 Tax=mine drainage metagenome TaxID=410659 RepID=E6QLM9_9ZZZZ